MIFKIDRTIADTCDVYTQVIYVEGVDNTKLNQSIQQLLQDVCSNVKNSSITEDTAAYKNAMLSMGVNPNKYPCSIDALVSRVKKQGEIPSILPIVDLGNYVSLKYNIPVGIHDADTIEKELCVRLANAQDCALPENSFDGDAIKEGEPVYATGNSIRTRRWFWRQMPAGRVGVDSKNFIILVDGFSCNKAIVDAAAKELMSKIKEFFQVDAKNSVINKENLEFVFGKMSDEEKSVEEQLMLILKGVAQHTAKSDMREKIRNSIVNKRPLRVKLGLDPSAPDIHIGHAVVLRKIRQLQDLGHVAVIIIGDYTGMIGDPTGKSKTRKQLSREEVEQNANTYMEQIFKIIDPNKTEVYYNSEWLSKMNFGDVIQLASKCTVARMLERDDFNNRYTNHLPLSVHEFFYPLMQAYDSVAIKADIELGGTDQTFNILLGRNIQRDYGQDPQLTIFMPLLEGVDGVEKMSKSLGNYIGISEPAAVIYEKVMKIPDKMIIKYYNLCTDVHPSEVNKLQRMLDEGTNPRDIKMMLAYEITALYSGEEAAKQAEERFKNVFQNNQVPDDAIELSVCSSAQGSWADAISNKLVENGYYKSKSEIRRLLTQGGVQHNGARISTLDDINFADGEKHILKIGKNKFFKIV